MTKYKVFQFVLFAVVVALGYLVWETIQEPVRFNKEKDLRTAVVVQRLKDIRTIQQIYRSINDTFAPSMDHLIHFLKTAQIPVVKSIYDPTDTLFIRTINDTIGYKPVLDSIFGNRPNFNPDELAYVPFSGGKKIEMNAGKINRGGVMVPVFMAKARKEYYLAGLNEEMIKNPQVKDLIVGSLEEPTLDGNWE